MNINEIILRENYFRNNKKISARELSLRIGKHEGYINKLECKNFNLPTKILIEILEVLEVTPEEFFADNYRTYQKDKELLHLIKSLPNNKKEYLINFINNK